MFFTVHSSKSPLTSSSNFPKAFLIRDNWDDFYFKTSFLLQVFDEAGVSHLLGTVKVGKFGMQKSGDLSPQIPEGFDVLDDGFFSLGQGESYYGGLMQLNTSVRYQILNGLRDVVADLSLFNKAIEERVTKVSLLRDVTPMTVSGQFRRLLDGGARLSAYDFSYQVQNQGGSSIPWIVLNFEVKPESNPPTNVHVLIGSNGVGKTRILNYMSLSLVDRNALPNQFGIFTSRGGKSNSEFFANLVSVSFSAFDDFTPLHENNDKTDGIKYSYIGLKPFRSIDEDNIYRPKTTQELTQEFANSVNACRRGDRANRWKKSVEMLESDPVFKEASITSLSNNNDNEKAYQIFEKLSSGHKVVLLTITRLVETVEERTLVLLDEPEAHLHPPLLSAFVRTLSELLVYRNGVAIIATHSPVILQEIPKSCVWKLRRNGSEAIAERPEIETFGENVGTLTREVFGLEVTQSGFHKLLQDAVNQNKSFKQTMQMFDNELGSEARAILRALIVERDSEEEM